MRYTKFALLLVFVLMTIVVASVTAQDGESLTIWADEISGEVMREIGADFAEEFGVEVTVVQIPFNDIRGQFTVEAPSGEGPDIIMGAHDWIGELVADGLLAPIDLGDNAEMFNPNAIDGFTNNDSLYGMPYAIDNTAFFRNVDLVPELPETWDDVRAIAEELAADDIYGYVIQQRDPWHSYTVVSAFGGYVFGFEEGVGYDPCDVGLDSEGTIAAYTYLGELAADGLMPLALQQESMWELFTQGEAAMMVTGPWALDTLDAAEDLNYAISAAPDGPGGAAAPFLSVRGFLLSAFSENSALAQTFLNDFVATDFTMQQLYDAERRSPAWLAVEVAEGLDGFAEAGLTGAPQPAIPEMNNVWEAWSNQMELSISDPSSAADEAGIAANTVRESIEGCEVED